MGIGIFSCEEKKRITCKKCVIGELKGIDSIMDGHKKPHTVSMRGLRRKEGPNFKMLYNPSPIWLISLDSSLVVDLSSYFE